MKVLILGAGGMLGNRLVTELSEFDLIAPSRKDYSAFDPLEKFGLKPEDIVINCIGAIPQKDYTPQEMYRLNRDFPNFLKTYNKFFFIQIATDCVYSGKRGFYKESSSKDAIDPYGASKSAGEVREKNWLHLRTSIIGSEIAGKRSLFEWIKNQPENATIFGYANHFWNGITTDAFGQIVAGILRENYFITGTQHIIPRDSVTKLQLVRMIANRLDRRDLLIIPKLVEKVDRRLDTFTPNVNRLLWDQAGYIEPPKIQTLISSMQVE